MKAASVLALVLGGASALHATTAYTIYSPTAVVSNTGGDFSSVCCDIVDTINQNGLTVLGDGFTNGQDAASYFAGNPLHTYQSINFGGSTGADDYEWFSQTGLSSATIIYDMGSSMSLYGLALWNEDSTGVGTITINACGGDSTCASPVNLLAAATVTPNTLGVNYGAQLFNLPGTSSEFVEVVVTTAQGQNQMAIGSIAFESSPEPSTWLLMSGGLALMIFGRSILQRRVLKSVKVASN